MRSRKCIASLWHGWCFVTLVLEGALVRGNYHVTLWWWSYGLFYHFVISISSVARDSLFILVTGISFGFIFNFLSFRYCSRPLRSFALWRVSHDCAWFARKSQRGSGQQKQSCDSKINSPQHKKQWETYHMTMSVIHMVISQGFGQDAFLWHATDRFENYSFIILANW